MMSNAYAGVGSRLTPEPVLERMRLLAWQLSHDGWHARSGGAKGADQAFEADPCCEVFLPWPGFEGHALPALERPLSQAYRIAAQFHPAWERLSPQVRALHARNAHIVLGAELDDPAQFMLCWTRGGRVAGGTGQAMRIAAAHGIPIVNFYAADAAQVRGALLDADPRV